MQESNEYLNQVLAEQQRVDRELKGWRTDSDYDILLEQEAEKAVAAGQPPPAAARPRPWKAKAPSRSPASTASQSLYRPRDYRITGFGFWKTVIVAPNAYVVHTRRGREQPLHVGLGVSFRYSPYSDAFLVVPAAVQTLLIAARCICKERQGILVQAYVQWVVDDIKIAYRKLDFSDPEDPMRVVNIQLREQAEAAIKDKVATMSIDDVLADKEPIIEELTHRLRTVAEGGPQGGNSTGLGLKIVTVQIKEAVVSSTRVWENLQKPFRAERERLARLAELETQRLVAERELANRQGREMAEIENARQLAQRRAEQEREVYDRDQAEHTRRHQLEQQAEQHAIAERTATEKARREADLDLALQQLALDNSRNAQEQEAVQRQIELDRARAEQSRQQTQAAQEIETLAHQAQSARAERDLTLFRLRREAENILSEQHVQERLIERLPEIAAALPKPDELRAITITPDQAASTTSLVSFLASLFGLTESSWKRPAQANGAPTS